MKRTGTILLTIFLLTSAGLHYSCNHSEPQLKERTFHQIAVEESLVPIHPGKPGVTPFWNTYSKRFIYAPAFDFDSVRNASTYHYEIVSKEDSDKYSFTSDVAYTPLSSVWKKLPVGLFSLRVTGVSKNGEILGVAGEGQYYHAAPFDGPYHKPLLPYDSSAMLALKKLLEKDYVTYWLDHGLPDPDYPLYRYPAKIMSALIIGAVTQARLKPNTNDAKRATRLASIIADYLISISYDENSYWPNFPPTYYGPRIGKNPDSHMQLVNNLTIMGADAGNAYLDLYDLTNEEKYLEAAKNIADTYVKNQLENGSWYLYVNHQTGKPIAENIAIPTSPVNYFNRLQRDYTIESLEQPTQKAIQWLMTNPVKTYNWQGQFEDVGTFPPYKRQSREQACDLAIYLFRNNQNIQLAEDLVRFAEDQFVIWEKPQDISIRDKPDPGWHSKNWITPCVQEQYGFWMPVNRSAGIMIQTYWEAYSATKKSIYLAKAKSIANSITVVQQANDGDYPTMFIKTPWTFWLNSVVYPAKVMMNLEKNLKIHGLKSSS